MSQLPPSLYDFLPRYIRFRDAEQGKPLEKVMETLQIPFREIYDNIGLLYDAWFIETCELWMVPYIGELLAIRGLSHADQVFPFQRTHVGNTIAYRRRKGTPAALARAVQSASGWYCHLRASRPRISRYQSLDALGLLHGRTVDLRHTADLESLSTSFDPLAHTVDFKPARKGCDPALGPGALNLTDIHLYLWRLQSYPIQQGQPRRVDAANECRFTFDPFGLDLPLFNQPQTPDDPMYRTTRFNLPDRLPKAALQREVEAHRQGNYPEISFLGKWPDFTIRTSKPDNQPGLEIIPPGSLEICDLSSWRPPDEENYLSRDSSGLVTRRPIRAAVDPDLGRILFLSAAPREVRVDYSYGFSADLGGGPYPRATKLLTEDNTCWRAIVHGDDAAFACVRNDCRDFSGTDHDHSEADSVRHHCKEVVDADGIYHFPNLKEALKAWNSPRYQPIPPLRQSSSILQDGVIQIQGNLICGDGEAMKIDLRSRSLILESADGCRPLIRGNLIVRGSTEAPVELGQTSQPSRTGESWQAEQPNRLHLNGLLVEGTVEIRGAPSLTITHCTIDPPRPGVPATNALEIHSALGQEATLGQEIALEIRNSILGRLVLPRSGVDLEMADSVVDGGGKEALKSRELHTELGLGGTSARLARCTFFGKVELYQVSEATNCLFVDPLIVELSHEGFVAYSYLPPHSRAPKRHRCQQSSTPSEKADNPALIPVFTSTRFGDPGYAQLGSLTDSRILYGGKGGNEIGAFHLLRQGDREKNLQTALDEYTPWGMTVYTSFVT